MSFQIEINSVKEKEIDRILMYIDIVTKYVLWQNPI